MPFVELPTGARLHYEDIGSGVPLILLHGRLGTALLDFPRVIEWLRPRYRVLGPSLRGYGLSEPKPRDFPVDFYHRDASDILAFIEALKLPKAHLMGYSDGGEVALICAGKQPDYFLSVAVWGAVGYFGPIMGEVVKGYSPDQITEEDLRPHGMTGARNFSLGWRAAVKFMVDSGGDVSLTLAEKITCPVLLMLGDKDRLNPQEYGQRFIERTARGRLAMFDCGHGVHDEQWEPFQQVVGDFLQAAEADAQNKPGL